MRLSAERVAELKRRAAVDIDEGNVPACQYALALDGELLVHETLGTAPTDARFSIWSSTKPVFASVVWQLMSERQLHADTRVVDVWPEFGAHGKDRVTLEHLLTFTAGFPDATLDLTSLEDRGARVLQMQDWTLAWSPGSAYAYHPLSAHWVMAEVVARIAGVDHRVALRERVLDPLGLDRLELGVPEERQSGLQPLKHCGQPATMQEIAEALGVSELPPTLEAYLASAIGSAAVAGGQSLTDLQQPAVVAAGLPGGGAVSDAASLALFYQALLHDPKGIWEPAVLRDVTTNVRNTFTDPVLGVVAMRTLGLELQGDDPTARFRIGGGVVSPQTFGHGGAAGQIGWADPVSGLSFAYLTNGEDRNAVRAARRGRELSAAAIGCAQ